MSFTLFSAKSKLLPGFCKPNDGEVLSSWLARLAYRHGVTALRLCRMLFNGRYSWNKDVDRVIKKEEIEVLAERTNTTIGEVQATTLSSFKSILFCSENISRYKEPWLLPSRWLGYYDGNGEKGYHFNSGLLFCPLCLGKNTFFKKQWRLALSFVCTECGCYLLDSCPHCGNGNSFLEVEGEYSWSDIDQYMLGCHSCGKDITECEPCMASKETMNLQQHLYDIMQFGSIGVPYIKECYLKVLQAVCSLLLKRRLKLRNLAADVFELNDVFYGAIKHYELRLLNTGQRADIISAAHWLLQKWPERFLNLCRNNYLTKDEVLSNVPLLPSWFTDPIIYALDYRTSVKPKNKMQRFIEYTARPKVMPIRTADYAYDMDEYFDEEELYYQPRPGYYRAWKNKYLPKGFKNKADKSSFPFWE